ncbi:MAG: class I SAM-dependent methyltransferase [Burkholderiaceae bacterium]|nr:class I SAM-dependent methyltransferase [Sulfuritalea sp.]MCF8173988.1 class I SAM-dependent methyltransferase [Burkholderiaceae bacterium]MCF8183729.1 class I SAM-dependent methyltransferase [Polynucleobacter sp.]
MTRAPVKAICSVATQSHIGQFLVLVRSILEHEPSLSVHLLVIDATTEETAAIAERCAVFAGRGDNLTLIVLSLDEIYGTTVDALRFGYDAFEICNVARGGLHKWLFEHTALESWFYLDGDMYCFGSLEPLFATLNRYDIVLSAHHDHPCSSAGEDLILAMYGPYNGGALGLRRSAAGKAFADWFFERMLSHGQVDPFLPVELQPNQRFAHFGDQTWLGLVPTYFENVLIQKARSLNFGPWSIGGGERFEAGPDGRPRVGPDEIVLLHLSGWQPEHPHRLSRHYPYDFSDNAWWREFTDTYAEKLADARRAFAQPYQYVRFVDGTPISAYQRRAFLKLLRTGKRLDTSPFESRNVIEGLAADFHTYDYVSPGFEIVTPDHAFPNMVEGNRHRATTPYLRKEVPHKWYVDIREPASGFVSRDEALLLYNTARMFSGLPALEIGAWMGWSACHLALGGVRLDIVDPLLINPNIAASITSSLAAAGVMSRCTLHAGASPAAVEQLAEATGSRWNLIFIDGSHSGDDPLADARVVARHAADDALIIFHDLAFPDVARGLAFLKAQGWQTMVYLTMQLMAVAWRGKAAPLRHVPDPRVTWHVPPWLSEFTLCR